MTNSTYRRLRKIVSTWKKSQASRPSACVRRNDRWRAVNAPHLVALVRADAVFVNGKLVERPGEDAPPEAA